MTDAPIQVTITQLVLAALPMTLAAIASFITSIRNHGAANDAAAKAADAKDAATATSEKVEEIRISVDGRLTELLEALREKAIVEAAAQRALGNLEGLAKGRELEREQSPYKQASP
jgi:hypothetical protein